MCYRVKYVFSPYKSYIFKFSPSKNVLDFSPYLHLYELYRGLKIIRLRKSFQNRTILIKYNIMYGGLSLKKMYGGLNLHSKFNRD